MLFQNANNFQATGGGPFDEAAVTRSVVVDGSSDYLSRTLGSPTNATRWIYSGWWRETELQTSGDPVLLGADAGSSDYTHLRLFGSTSPANTLALIGNSGVDVRYNNDLIRDQEWFHVLLSVDTNESTAADRIQMRLNGVTLTPSGSPTYPSSAATIRIGTAMAHYINRLAYGSTSLFHGKIAQQALLVGDSFQNGVSVDSFGRFFTVGTNGQVWAPVADATVKTAIDSGEANGSVLLSSDIGDGTDDSTHANNWTATSLTDAADGSNDSPSNPYVIFSRLPRGSSGTHNNATAGGETILVNKTEVLSLAVQPGQKAVVEFVLDALNGSSNTLFGIADMNVNLSAELLYNSPGSASGAECYGYWNDGNKGSGPGSTGNKSSYGNTFTDGDRIQLILDNANGNLFYAKNGTLQNSATSGEIEAGTGTNAAFSGLDTAKTWQICVGNWSGADSQVSVVGHEDAATDTIYSGFHYLNNNQIAAPAVQGADVFNAILYTGNGSTQSITGAGFQPDAVWGKGRSTTHNHEFYDSSRGATKRWYPSSTAAEDTHATGLTSFDSDGFSLGSGVGLNTSSATQVAWCWKANGGTTGSNTDGDITTTVQAEANGCFSIVQYTGNATANQDIGHGLGKRVAFVMVKNRTDAVSAMAWFQGMADQYLRLSGTDAINTGHFDGAEDTSTLRIEATSNVNGSGDDMVAFFFGLVAGVVAGGEYGGNGSTDGPFINCGFKPRFILIKTHGTASWKIYDTARDPENFADKVLYPDATNAEAADEDIDILAQGFKIRSSSSTINTNASRYSYLAIADVAGGVGLPPIPGR